MKNIKPVTLFFFSTLILLAGCTRECYGQFPENYSPRSYTQCYFSLPSYLRPDDDIYNLPIGKIDGKNLALRFELPKRFIMGNFCPIRPYLIEFIPFYEDINNWTEIITILEAHTCDAHAFLQCFKEIRENKYPNEKICHSELNFHEEKGIQVAPYLVDGWHADPATNLRPSKLDNEILLVYAVDSTVGVWTVQYAFKYPKNLNRQEKKLLIEKLLKFKPCVIEEEL